MSSTEVNKVGNSQKRITPKHPNMEWECFGNATLSYHQGAHKWASVFSHGATVRRTFGLKAKAAPGSHREEQLSYQSLHLQILLFSRLISVSLRLSALTRVIISGEYLMHWALWYKIQKCVTQTQKAECIIKGDCFIPVFSNETWQWFF